MKQGGILFICLLFFLQPDAVGASLERGMKALESGDTQTALSEVMKTLQEQQRLLNDLLLESKKQKQLIDQQSELIQSQQKELSEQKNQIAKAPQMPEGFQNYSDNVSAEEQFDKAYDVQRIGLFEVRRKQMKPFLEKAVIEFRKVVVDFPTSTKADDAQFRIAKIYHRYLKDESKARKEYEFLVSNYPDSAYSGLAKEALSELR